MCRSKAIYVKRLIDDIYYKLLQDGNYYYRTKHEKQESWIQEETQIVKEVDDFMVDESKDNEKVTTYSAKSMKDRY